MLIRAYDPADEEAVIDLWHRCGLTRPWNDPRKDIARKRKVRPDQFLVGVVEGVVVATAIAGYDGHRGWIYYLGVDPSPRLKTIRVVEPAKRKAGVKVGSVAELVQKLRTEAKVI